MPPTPLPPRGRARPWWARRHGPALPVVLALVAAVVAGSLAVGVWPARASSAGRHAPLPALAARSATAATHPMGATGRWRLVFDDEFNGSHLDQSIWRTCYDWGCTIATNNEQEYYVASNVSLGGGHLSLTATEQPAGGRNFSSGMIQSNGRFDFQYGFMEIRAKVPTSAGSWPAFWAVPQNGSWPPEIDAMEYYARQPREVQETVHLPPGNIQLQHIAVGPPFGAGYHIYAADWEPGSISFYVDGRLQFRVAQSPSLPMYLIANLAVSGYARTNSPGYPSDYSIDWIRVYQHPGVGSSSCPGHNCLPVPS